MGAGGRVGCRMRRRAERQSAGGLECALRKAHRLGFAEGLVVGAGLVAGVIAITLLLRQMI